MTTWGRRPLIGMVSYGLNESRDRYGVPTEYVASIERAGAHVVLIPPTDRTDVTLLDLLNGLMLIGGGDVDPGRYGAEPHPTIEGVDLVRDAVELAVATRALAISLPTLAICRGAQLLNVALGGTLIQHLPDQTTGANHRGAGGATEASFYLTERIRVAPDSQLADVCGATSLEVAASHHQAIATLGGSLRAVAWAADGVVEAVELPDNQNLLAVQWHPERTAFRDPTQHQLFEWLVERATSTSPA